MLKEPLPLARAKPSNGSRLQLEQGAIELTLQNGVEAMVRAPADLTLINEALLIQNQGIVRYVVPAPAVGFQVRTPQLLVTDFGTIFGVISDSEEQDQVHLFQGEIEVKCRLGLRNCLLYTSPSPRDQRGSRMPSSA